MISKYINNTVEKGLNNTGAVRVIMLYYIIISAKAFSVLDRISIW